MRPLAYFAIVLVFVSSTRAEPPAVPAKWTIDDVVSAEAAGDFQVPVLPSWHRVVSAGELESADVQP